MKINMMIVLSNLRTTPLYALNIPIGLTSGVLKHVVPAQPATLISLTQVLYRGPDKVVFSDNY